MCESSAEVSPCPRLRLERRAQRGGRAGIAVKARHRLVGHELRLHDDAGVRVEGLDDVAHRCDRPLDEGDEAQRRDPRGLAGG